MASRGLLLVAFLCQIAVVLLDDPQYHPDWDSLDTRPLPTWYDDAKFGIFMHWGLFSVPSFKNEWFWWWWKGDTPDPEYVAYMAKNYKPDFTYQDFGAAFWADLFSESEFADIVSKSGAK